MDDPPGPPGFPVVRLIENAVRYMGDQPWPRIDIGVEQRLTETAVPETVVFVRDNGLGIDSRYHKKVFGLFERLDAETQGTGVGLALVKRIVELHGGEVWVESAGQRQGSAFYFTLAQQSLDQVKPFPEAAA